MILLILRYFMNLILVKQHNLFLKKIEYLVDSIRQILPQIRMMTGNILRTSETANIMSIKQRVNSFKHHLAHLQKISAKHITNKTVQKHTENLQYPTIYSKFSKFSTPEYPKLKLPSRYEKQKLNNLQHQNQQLLAKLIKIDHSHSQYYQTRSPSKIQLARNNYLITKFGERKRSLSQISLENQRISHKLFRCKSSYKLNQNNTTSIYFINNQKKSLSKKSKNIFLDYRILAQKEMKKNSPLKIGNNLRLQKKIV